MFTAWVCVFGLAVSCSGGTEEGDEKNVLVTSVMDYDQFNNILLTTTREEMEKTGFTPGDEITVEIGGSSYDVPYYTGYFTRNEELVIVDYPSIKNTIFTAKNTGVKDRFPDMKGKTIKMTLKEKGAYADVQRTLGRKYTNDRDDYLSDEMFANAREVATTGMKRGVLYRTASPFDNVYGRAPYVAEFLMGNGVKTALDLTDNADMLRGYADVPAYARQMVEAGDVVLCKVDANYRGEKFNRTVVEGLVEMMGHPAPYVVHCTEGKDRTGYVCAMLEALTGATYEEIAADYLLSFYNYYRISQENDATACRLLLDLTLDDAMMFFCHVDDAGLLRSMNLREAMEQHLMRYGMTAEQVKNLEELLQEQD